MKKLTDKKLFDGRKTISWVKKNYQKHPESTITLRADELFEVISLCCYEQYETDCRKFNEELKGIFGSGESDKETPKA